MPDPVKFNRGDQIGFCFTIDPGLEEDQVRYVAVLPILKGLPASDIDIWQFCVTEMVNNAIDHSNASTLTVTVRRGALEHRNSGN